MHSRYVPMRQAFAEWIHEIHYLERLRMAWDPEYVPTITPMAMAMLLYEDMGNKEEAAKVRKQLAKYLQIDKSLLEGLRYHVAYDS